MRLEILGCSGGVSLDGDTTSFLVDDGLLIDAGTGVSRLNLERCLQIKTVVLTHSHLDHLCHLPFLLNNILGKIAEPLHVYGLEETITALKQNVFNDVIWPDFTKIPTLENPSIVFHAFVEGDVLAVEGKIITVLPAEHTVPAVGFHVAEKDNEKACFAFSGDSAKNQGFWMALNLLTPAEMVIVDNQYLESEKEISRKAKHYYAMSLKEDFSLLNYSTKLYLTHLPPNAREEVFREASQVFSPQKIYALKEGLVYNFPLGKNS